MESKLLVVIDVDDALTNNDRLDLNENEKLHEKDNDKNSLPQISQWSAVPDSAVRAFVIDNGTDGYHSDICLDTFLGIW